MMNAIFSPRRLLGQLYFQVIVGVVVGVLLGVLHPSLGEALKPLGDGFLKLIRMLLAPIVFATIVVGIAKMGNVKEVGRVGVKALIYFEVVSTFALVVGLVVVNVLRPGAGMNIDPSSLDPREIASYTTAGKSQDAVSFLLDIIPTSIVDALARGQMLQIIFFAALFGVALAKLPDRGRVVVDLLEALLHGLFGVVRIVIRLAPLGALGAMAFTVGKYGFGVLASLGRLAACVYLTCITFVVVVLGIVARMSGISLWSFIKYIKDEIVIVFATASTEAVLPRMMTKLEHLGCAKPVVGMVLPVGYTFNADGTSIYLTMAAIFVAQATNTPLSFGDQLLVLSVLLFTSKGSAGVAGAGFVTLAATLASMSKIPVAGMVLLLGVDRFLNEARAVTNLIGNGVATVAVARWEGAFDQRRAALVLGGGRDATAPVAETEDLAAHVAQAGVTEVGGRPRGRA